MTALCFFLGSVIEMHFSFRGQDSSFSHKLGKLGKTVFVQYSNALGEQLYLFYFF